MVNYSSSSNGDRCIVNLARNGRLETASTQTKPTSVGFKTLYFLLIRAGGLRLCSREFYSPKLKLTTNFRFWILDFRLKNQELLRFMPRPWWAE
ncbi:hypothetical protein PQG02_23875 [Nostoc sp. UHCC 0926]|uniref:hypothetical protein n=1 Tax=Nostoc sp. TaxID=1180 RepID=UPI0027A3CAF6|nr:hypothetical protein PQG02_23875 [Nostoc sp. UHCC 0926]